MGVAHLTGRAPAIESLAVWRALVLSQLRESPVRVAVAVLAIALGIALGAAVYWVNTAALNEFGAAANRLVGTADLVVRGPPEGFSESLYAELAHDSSIEAASPVLELEVAVPGRRDTLKVLGVDPFRAAAVQPELIADISGSVLELMRSGGIFLSAVAARDLHRGRGDALPVIVGNSTVPLTVVGLLAEDTYREALGLMDIASAQWRFERIGRLNRIDLRVRPGIDVDSYRSALAHRLPAGVLAVVPRVERDRAITLSRAYRVNLNLLALVALWTGAFLVFSTQSLAVLRRRRSLGLLRALGVTRGELILALVGEGAALGIAGSVLGIALGGLLAIAVLRLLAGDLGNGQLHAAYASLHASPVSMLAFLAIGTLAASAGAWQPARAAARQSPARAMKGDEGEFFALGARGWRLGLALLVLGVMLARLPAVGGLPLPGYAAIAALLLGAVLWVPVPTLHLLRNAPLFNRVVPDTALAQLKDNVALSTWSLASVIVSFSLMVAMAIMVHSFRLSFDHWLGKLLPADLQMRAALGNDTASWSPAVQEKLSAAAGVSKIEFRRTRPLLVEANRPPVILIARNATPAETAAALPMIRSLPLPLPDHAAPAFISEALQDLYGYRLGNVISLPLAGRERRFTVAGVWRDYARPSGAIAIARPAYIEATGDRAANEASVWLEAGTGTAAAATELRACFPRPDVLEILTSTALKERSLQIFDRTFAITYALEVIAVLIGLTAVSVAASSTALARRAEFGMLRHIGMRRAQVIGMLASEGVLMSLMGVVYGLALGLALSLVLVHVVNRQSFHWSIDFAVPVAALLMLSASMIAAAAITAVWSGRAALSQDAVRAVHEDW